MARNTGTSHLLFYERAGNRLSFLLLFINRQHKLEVKMDICRLLGQIEPKIAWPQNRNRIWWYTFFFGSSKRGSKANFLYLQAAQNLLPHFICWTSLTVLAHMCTTHAHALTYSCAQLQQRTVAISPPLASSPVCDCYWKCRAATGASSWCIYMPQVQALVCAHTSTHTSKSGGTQTSSPQRLDLISAT